MNTIPFASAPLIPCRSHDVLEYPNHHDPLYSSSEDLKQFFIGLHSFSHPHNQSESGDSSPSSPSSSGSSTLAPSDDDEPLSIFSLDKEVYDFESQLPPSVISKIQEFLEEPDTFDERFEQYKELNPEAPSFVPSGTFSGVPIPTDARPVEQPILLAGTRPRLPPIITVSEPSFSLPQDNHSLSSIPLSKPRIQAPWLKIFSAASLVSPDATSVLASHALELAHGNVWHPTALGELSQQFLWTASSPDAGALVSMVTAMSVPQVAIRETMAPFAMEVYRALFNTYDEETAMSFVWHLRESVVGTFKAAWCAKESSKAISYHFPPSPEYVLSATYLCAFIGDLFRFNLVLIQHIRLCLSILMQELNSLEHITATGVLLSHAGPTIWHFNPPPSPPTSLLAPLPLMVAEQPRVAFEALNIFKREFLAKTAGLQNGSSVFLRRNVMPGVSERDRRVGEVLSVLARCFGETCS